MSEQPSWAGGEPPEGNYPGSSVSFAHARAKPAPQFPACPFLHSEPVLTETSHLMFVSVEISI